MYLTPFTIITADYQANWTDPGVNTSGSIYTITRCIHCWRVVAGPSSAGGMGIFYGGRWMLLLGHATIFIII